MNYCDNRWDNEETGVALLTEYDNPATEFNNTFQQYPQCTIVDLFEQQVRKAPFSTAIYVNDLSMTYDELNRKSNRLARYLIAAGVQKEDNIGVLTNRSFNMIIALLAILKAGAAYVPIEPEYPPERQLYMLRQSGVKCVLTNIDTPPGYMAQFTVVDLRSADFESYSNQNPSVSISNRQLAYTIYTSGSTGVPKGVMIEHHSVVNLVTWVNSRFNVNKNDRLLFITSVCFDLSVYDIFGMLAAGGGIVIATKEDVLCARTLSEMINKFRITFWDSVPTTMDHLLNRLGAEDVRHSNSSLRLVFLSGDWIPVGLPEKINRHFENAQVISLGGATECTVWSNFFSVRHIDKAWRSIPYGKPIANNAFYILDEHLQPVPIGSIGELFIGGVGVARGYAADPEKTTQSFLPDPFTQKWGGRMYRTGDLGRMLPDGNMEFIGRKDSQVKIRGHRVELGEIESVIRQCESVANVVVLFNDDKLTCYLVPGKYYDRDTISTYAKTKLPEYMIPVKWIELEHMPLNTNGKIDKKALSLAQVVEQTRYEFVAPRNELENKIALSWQEVLGVPAIGVNDNFFDLGGQSLLAVELISELEKKINKRLPLNILYKCPTIAQLAVYINKEYADQKWKSLVSIKPSGNKMPIYILPGDGLSLSNFHNLGEYVDDDQPIYSLKPIGIDGKEEPPESIVEMAKYYVDEILQHNPAGPYALAGYSFGGYVAIEIKKQLEMLGKTVKMVAIFDTDAEHAVYKKSWFSTLPKRIKRQIPKLLFIAKSLYAHPLSTIKYQYTVLSKKINEFCYFTGIKRKTELRGVNLNMDKINETHVKAFRNYHLSSFNDKIYLFKAKLRVYFVDDFEHLGWTNYAMKGVSVYEVPGDHKTMFHAPNVRVFGKLLQHALDHC